MIKILTLIIAAVWLFSAGCSGDDSQNQQPAPDTSLSGVPEGGTDDPLKQLQDEGKLPGYGTGAAKAPILPTGSGVLSGSGPEVTSLYLPAVDPDGDNVPNVPILGHPEIKLDNCPTVFNPDQADANHNGVGDACE